MYKASSRIHILCYHNTQELYTVWGKKIECKQKDVNKDPNEHLTCQINLPTFSPYYNMFTPLDVQKCKTVLKYAEKWENSQCFI